MPRNRTDILLKAAIASLTLLVLLIVCFELYEEAVAVACLAILWFSISHKFSRRRSSLRIVYILVAALLVFVVNRWVTHTIVLENASGRKMLMISVSVGDHHEYTLQNIPTNYRLSWQYRSLFYDGSIRVQGVFLDDNGPHILGGSRDTEGRYSTKNHLIIRPDGSVRVMQD
ncbi:MAG: hypothetical protein GY842_06005 [bacterium]|nr:hypothetical protein [bacterium]